MNDGQRLMASDASYRIGKFRILELLVDVFPSYCAAVTTHIYLTPSFVL